MHAFTTSMIHGFLLCLAYPRLPVSLNYLVLISHSVLSNVYYLWLFFFITCFLKTINGFDIKDQHWSVQTSFSNSYTTTTVESVSYTIVQKSTTVSCSGYWVTSIFLFPTHSWQLKVQCIGWYKHKARTTINMQAYIITEECEDTKMGNQNPRIEKGPTTKWPKGRTKIHKT